MEEIEATVSVIMEENMEAILEQRYRINGKVKYLCLTAVFFPLSGGTVPGVPLAYLSKIK